MQKNKILIISACLVMFLTFILTFKVDGTQTSNFCLKSLSHDYNQAFLSQDGRIIDYDRNGITTSEGQSYILLQSVVMNDEHTFNLAYKWAKDNLQRKDKLFGWLWGKKPDGSYKIIDDNSASDADIDIAFALLLAHEKWRKYIYLQEALPIINSIWNNEIISEGTNLVLMPGVNQALNKNKIEVNPSYFSVYAFKFFQKYDDLHDWNRLVDSSYYYLNKSMESTKTGLPPDWFLLKGTEVVLEPSPRSNFSYDAVRVFARAYLDYCRTGDKRNLKILEASKFFIPRWKESGKFYTNYTPEGNIVDNTEFTGSIAVLLPVIAIYDKQTTNDIYQKKIMPYVENENNLESHSDYYAKNLIWFGCYLKGTQSSEYKQMAKFGKQFQTKHSQ